MPLRVIELNKTIFVNFCVWISPATSFAQNIFISFLDDYNRPLISFFAFCLFSHLCQVSVCLYAVSTLPLKVVGVGVREADVKIEIQSSLVEGSRKHCKGRG